MIGNKKILWLLLKCVVLLLIISIIFVILFDMKISETIPTRIILENIQDAIYQPKEARNIFFIDSIRVKLKVDEGDQNLNARQACSIESAALTNPHLQIFLLVIAFEPVTMKRTHELDVILSYPNVHINRLNPFEFAVGTPLEDFIFSKKLFNSSYLVEHVSDVFRLLVLWKYGGTYSDHDMIFRQSIDIVQPNFACSDVAAYMNGGFLNFDQNEGRRLNELFLNELIDTFNGSIWGQNNPLLIMRVLKRLCNTNSTYVMVDKGNCDGFHVYSYQLCTPVSGSWWYQLFNESFSEKAMRKVSKSLVVHFSNSLSKNTILLTNSTAAYIQLAKQFCPKSVYVNGEHF